MRTILNLIFGFLIIGLISCWGIKSIDENVYIGNFSEKQYDFFESIRHNKFGNYYYRLPFDLKFGGIRPFPFDTVGEKDYSWLRDPYYLTIAYNTFATLGLDKFVPQENYFEKNNDWCCNTQWENKSLNEIVKGFTLSDTNSNGTDYYSKFWQRRKNENNLSETYNIFLQIDKFYNTGEQNTLSGQTDTVLYGLIDYDTRLIYSDSTEYLDNAVEYFGYLKLLNLDYSAYKLIFNNSRFFSNKEFNDSLLMTLDYDTLSIDDWRQLNDNISGWISGDLYPDPRRNYGP